MTPLEFLGRGSWKKEGESGEKRRQGIVIDGRKKKKPLLFFLSFPLFPSSYLESVRGQAVHLDARASAARVSE